jgi:hypothetical protein
VCGLLVVAALTKVGHPHWAIGGMITVYVLYLAMQYAKHSAGYAHALGVADSIIMNVRTSTVGLTTAATIAVATVVMSAAVVASVLPTLARQKTEVAHPPPTLLVNRSFAMSPTQIERCLLEEQRDDSTAFSAARSPDLLEDGLRCQIRILAR